MHTWARRYDRELLRGCMSPEFVSHAPSGDVLRAVFHDLPRQKFSNTNDEKVLQSGFRKALLPRQLQLEAPTRLCIEFFKERLQPGSVFSLPALCFEMGAVQPPAHPAEGGPSSVRIRLS